MSYQSTDRVAAEVKDHEAVNGKNPQTQKSSLFFPALGIVLLVVIAMVVSIFADYLPAQPFHG